MMESAEHQKNAVQSGYWPLYRYNPELEDAGKKPFVWESKDPKMSFQDFLRHERRYTSLARTTNDTEAQRLFEEAEKDAMRRFEFFRKLGEIM